LEKLRQEREEKQRLRELEEKKKAGAKPTSSQ
jgi:hypothetical protein